MRRIYSVRGPLGIVVVLTVAELSMFINGYVTEKPIVKRAKAHFLPSVKR